MIPAPLHHTPQAHHDVDGAVAVSGFERVAQHAGDSGAVFQHRFAFRLYGGRPRGRGASTATGPGFIRIGAHSDDCRAGRCVHSVRCGDPRPHDVRRRRGANWPEFAPPAPIDSLWDGGMRELNGAFNAKPRQFGRVPRAVPTLSKIGGERTSRRRAVLAIDAFKLCAPEPSRHVSRRGGFHHFKLIVRSAASAKIEAKMHGIVVIHQQMMETRHEKLSVYETPNKSSSFGAK